MLLGELDINGSPALAALHKISEGFEKLEHNIKAFAGEFAGFFIVFETISKIAESMEGVLQMGAHLQALHNATGASVHDLVIFGRALEDTGGSADSAQNFIFKLQNAIAGVNEDGKQTSEALKLLGTSAGELREMPLLEQVEKLQVGLSKIPDQATRVAVMKDLFGFRFAAQAMPLLTNPEGLEHAKQVAEPMANLMQRNAEKFHELEVAMKDSGFALQTFFAGILESVAPDATHIADAMARINFEGIGQTIGILLDMFLKLASILAMLAPVINWISEKLSHLIRSLLGNSEGEGKLAPSLAGLFGQEHSAVKEAKVGTLQRIGLGGGFSISGNDPMLTEAQRHTQLLTSIDSKLGASPESGIPGLSFPAI